MKARWGDLDWTEWIPLDSSLGTYRDCIPRKPGFYRVRVIGRDVLAYVGQTGRSLHERTRELSRQVYRVSTNPPWNDPHTAGPALWAWRQDDRLGFELSVAPFEAKTPRRQCYEDLLLRLYRLEAGVSTLANHGRFHPRWTRPTNRKRGRAMSRIRRETNPASGKSLTPAADHGMPEDDDWLELPWCSASRIDVCSQAAPPGPGVYRVMAKGQVVYLGETRSLRDRLAAHRARFGSDAFASWVEMPGALPHQLKERETDMIGAFFTSRQRCPSLQYASRRD